MSAQTDKLIADLLSKGFYKYKDMAKRDIAQALAYFKELTPKMDKYTYPNGFTKDLVSLNGTIPVNFKNNRYNIPIQLYLADTHPYTPPIVYVRPTSDMCINVSDTVDSSGRVMLPCLTEWSHPKSDLYFLINLLSIRFSEQTPLYAKPAGGVVNPPIINSSHQQSSSSTASSSITNPLPYPVDNFGGNKPLYPMPSSTSYSTPYPSMPDPYNGSYPSQNPYYPMPQPISHLKSGPNNNIGSTRPTMPYGTASVSSTSTGSQQPSNYADDTIKPEYYRMSLISAVDDKIKSKRNELMDEKLAEIDSLRRVKNDLENSQQYLSSLINEAEMETKNVQELSSELKRRAGHLNLNLTRMKNRDQTNIEDAVVTTTPLYRQLLQLYAEETAIQDLIFYLSEGLTHKTVSLENFLKQVRFLTRKQFMLRATMSKAREKATLPL
jgi:ESCRT-I complex subunit TSG101